MSTAAPITPAESLGRLESLIETYLDNERLLRRLEKIKRDADRAREYLGRPESNRPLGLARLAQLRRRRWVVLGRLEANWKWIEYISTLPGAE